MTPVKMRFREHRGGLADSLATEVTVTVADRADLIAHCRKLLDPYSFTFSDADLTVTYYDWDSRINWPTYVVSIRNYGVIGFTDWPVTDG